MVKSILVIIIVFFSVNIKAQSAEEGSYEHGIKSVRFNQYDTLIAKKISIKENGIWSESRSSSEEIPEDCAEFKLNQRDVREFFRYARRINKKIYWDVLNYSRCYASGEVTFSDGIKGTWEIDAFRRGTLTLTDGHIIYFFCTKCTAKVFYDYQ